MQPILNVAFAAARKAARLIMRYADRLDELKIIEKQQNDFVTEVDRQAETIIVEELRKAYPSHCILGEEHGVQGDTSDEITWIIDPIDGTLNYTHGLPQFCISIAVKRRDQIEHGLIYDPTREELFYASRGEGARLNDRRIRVSSQKMLKSALVATGFPVRSKSKIESFLPAFNSIIRNCSDMRCGGSAALDLAYVAAGRYDCYFESGLAIWDIAAGALLVKEAGGYVSDFSGKDNYLDNGNILASNPKIFPELLVSITDNSSPA